MTTIPKLGLLAIVPALLLAVAPVSAGPLPTCADPCQVNASATHYDPPVVVIANNSTVFWHSTDVGHIQRETSQPAGSTSTCFVANSPGGGDSPLVRFEIQGNVLNATVGSTTSTCLNAVALDGQGFVVPYHCTLHADMRGFIVVQA